uniref:Membrane-spanning 4-domains subfamily A member 15-like n=1 Tax=Erpetoichthys calabaricus TaxID=27687 RepID=A0A8C4RLI7_ERPCA
MSTSLTTANGMLVITQVVPQNDGQAANTTTTVPVQVAMGTNFCPVPQKLQRFLEGEPKALGVVQIMIGVINIGFGIVLAFPGSLAVISGISFWASIMYIISGTLSICATNKMQPCQIKGALATNIVSTIFSCIGIMMYSVDLGVQLCYDDCYYYYSFQAAQGIKGVLLIFTILEFWVSLFTSIYGCKATCGNPDQPLIIIQQNVDPSGIPVQIPQYNVPLQTTPITQPYDQPANMQYYPPPYAK